MQNDKIRRLLPVSGVISSLLLIASIVITPSISQLSATNHAEVLAAYDENSTTLTIAGFPLTLLAIFFFIPFLAELSATIRSGEAGEAIYSTLATIGGTIVAMAILAMGMFETIVAGAADAGLSDDSILSIVAIYDMAWMPWVVGSAVLLLAAGIGGLRTAALPKPISWVAVVLGGLCVTGIGGIAVYFLAPLWLLGTSVVLLRARRAKGSSRNVDSSTPLPAAS